MCFLYCFMVLKNNWPCTPDERDQMLSEITHTNAAEDSTE